MIYSMWDVSHGITQGKSCLVVRSDWKVLAYCAWTLSALFGTVGEVRQWRYPPHRIRGEILMIHLTCTKDEIQQLHYERFHHPHPRVQRTMEAVYLTAIGFSRVDAAQALRCTDATVPTLICTPWAKTWSTR